MDSPGSFKKNIFKGLEVEINPRSDRSRKIRVSGVVEDILTNSSQHTHGILVRLEGGEVGRVKKILDSGSGADVQPDGDVPATENILSVNHLADIETQLIKGEDEFNEFKSGAFWSTKMSNEEINAAKDKDLHRYRKDTSKFLIARAIASFLNTEGGRLLVGVKENKETGENIVVGVETEFDKFRQNDRNLDGYRRLIVESIFSRLLPEHIVNHFNKYIRITFYEINNKNICVLNINKGDEPTIISVKINNTISEYFFIRTDAMTKQLGTIETVQYCKKRFK